MKKTKNKNIKNLLRGLILTPTLLIGSLLTSSLLIKDSNCNNQVLDQGQNDEISEPFDDSVSNGYVIPDSITTTSAVISYTVRDANGFSDELVYMVYRETSSGSTYVKHDWTTQVETSAGVYTQALTSLSPASTYYVYFYTSSNPGVYLENLVFTTMNDSSVESVIFDYGDPNNENDATATLTYNYNFHVKTTSDSLQYQVKDSSGTVVSSWTNTTSVETTDEGTYTLDISGLTDETTYTVEFKDSQNKIFTYTFITTEYPKINITSVDEYPTKATINYSYQKGTSFNDPQYRVLDSTGNVVYDWQSTPAQEETQTDSIANYSFTIYGLNPDENYIVEIKNPNGDIESYLFTTDTNGDGSEISNIRISKLTSTSIKIYYDYNYAGGTGDVEYRLIDQNGVVHTNWTNASSQPITSTGTQQLEISNLTPNTSYVLQFRIDGQYYGDSFTFKTYVDMPSIVNTVYIENGTLTSTSVTINYSYLNYGSYDDVIEYRVISKNSVTPTINWTDTGNDEVSNGEYSIDITGLASKTTYTFEIRINGVETPNNTLTFTTL